MTPLGPPEIFQAFGILIAGVILAAIVSDASRQIGGSLSPDTPRFLPDAAFTAPPVEPRAPGGGFSVTP